MGVYTNFKELEKGLSGTEMNSIVKTLTNRGSGS